MILNRAMVSVNCKLLSLNLWIVLTRWPERTVNKAEVSQHVLEIQITIVERGQIRNDEGSIPSLCNVVRVA